ncbi:hypothetical protein C7I87_06460 [Mesorhizobium sp. SARCC-RB16n]|uniref:hypothetical protein n=1 Tax=Mesorhizobium sp. SARCC-RB16n TaxID=2116687 RepID=UPI00122EA7CC|nr:hypothetical protein [Mesorhizobium sp. SARCC-RB16n]KAA3451644.1 hypothetical protein C7I87_06460 [Mesorhizobium sp. SARCC-RB16n]
MTKEDGELPEVYFEGLLKHREAMVELRSDQLTTLDKSLLSVSSGALGISIVFMDKIGGGSAPVSGYLLTSWICFGAAISANITSYFTGGEDAQREIQKIDRCIITSTGYESGGNPFRGLTQALNVAALVLFILGVISLALHAYSSTRMAPNGTTTTSQLRTTGNPQPTTSPNGP